MFRAQQNAFDDAVGMPSFTPLDADRMLFWTWRDGNQTWPGQIVFGTATGGLFADLFLLYS
jgi:hypothetical protein